MRKIVMAGLVTLTAVLGGAVPAAAATTTTTTTTTAAGPSAAVRLAADPTDSGGAFFSGGPGRISCASAKSCLAVSATENGSGNAVPTAEAWNGKAWKSLAVALPKGAEGGLSDVSCKQASCLAIGSYLMTNSVNFWFFAVTWNGKSLRRVPAPPAPGGAIDADLNAVSCASARSCVAIGTSFATAAPRVLIDTWNGAKWKEQTAATPAGVGTAELSGVSCLSATSCVAGGMAVADSGSVKPLLASWNGRAVTAMKAPAPADGRSSEALISDVSCVSATRCAAVGYDVPNISAAKGFAFTEVLSGKTWKEGTVAWPKGTSLSLLLGVSCAAPSSCLAVGDAGPSSSNDAAAVSYNGKTWTRQTNLPGPGKGNSDFFGGVSCVSARDCVATGGIGKSSGKSTRSLAGFFNGKSWKLVDA